MAGVWGVCGDTGFPGEDETDIEVAATIGGTLDNCRLDELEERWSIAEEVIDSVNALFDSRIDWNFESWSRVLWAAALFDFSKLVRVFLLSKSFKKSEMLSSSVCRESELAPPASASMPEPGWTDEETLCLPLLPWSSSVTILLAPPKDDLPRRWPKLLLYLLIGVGLGELDMDEAIALSARTGPPRSVAGIPAVREDRFLAWARALIPDVRGNDCGDWGRSISLCKGFPRLGDEDNEPALKGWKDTDGLRTMEAPSRIREVITGLLLGKELIGGELGSEPIVLAALSADIGLEPLGGTSCTSPWNVDKLP